MKALRWYGRSDVRYEDAPDPVIEEADDIIVKITSTAICGSDLHLYDGYMPTMEDGDIIGHEFMGEVVEVGSANEKLKVGDRVVIPFNMACGTCFFCTKQLFACCDNSNTEDGKKIAEKMMGHSPAALFGYSHMLGGFAGGQAEYARVPYSSVGPLKIENDLPDEQLLFLSDIFPTGYMAAENANIEPGDTVAVWGCGPVGQMTIQCAWMLGAGRVVAIDWVPERLAMAAASGRAETINFLEQDVYDTLQAMTGGRGPDSCIDTVGAEAHGTGSFDAILDKAKAAVLLATDRPHALRQAIFCCRKGGTVSIPGVYIGMLDKFPMGGAHGKGLTLKMGQTHTHKYMVPLLKMIEDGKIDPSFVITHRLNLSDGPDAYKDFRDKKDGCIKVVMKP